MMDTKLLTIWAVVLLLATSVPSSVVQAHCKGKHGGDPECETHDHDSGGQGGKTDGNLEASFCLNIDDTAVSELSLDSDGYIFPGNGEDYCDDRDQRVSVATGKGPGFNFNTYTRNGGNWVRWMTVYCTQNFIDSLNWKDQLGDPLNPIRCNQRYAMTFRFDKDNGGLDLGSLALGQPGGVSIFSGLTADNGDSWMFAHGTVDSPATSGHLANNPCVAGDYPYLGQTTDLQVTRIRSDTWTFSHSGDVCLWDRDASLEFQPGIRLYMDYQFTIVCENPADCTSVP